MASELIAQKEQGAPCEDDPRFCVCYARGAVFRREKDSYRVEKGARRVIHRSLCLTHHYESRCTICPNGTITVELTIQPKEIDP
jgi:hypothetical protein